MNILGLDLSEKRCGVALYKNNNLTPLFTIVTKPRSDFLCEIASLIEKHEINKIVIGLNLRADSTVPKRFDFIKHMAHSIKQKTGIDYVFVNEHNSTQIALKYKKNHHTDAFAAKVILDRYIKQEKTKIIENKNNTKA